jgi:hypothetical protein
MQSVYLVRVTVLPEGKLILRTIVYTLLVDMV